MTFALAKKEPARGYGLGQTKGTYERCYCDGYACAGYARKGKNRCPFGVDPLPKDKPPSILKALALLVLAALLLWGAGQETEE